jgi:hypothetical protein
MLITPDADARLDGRRNADPIASCAHLRLDENGRSLSTPTLGSKSERSEALPHCFRRSQQQLAVRRLTLALP